MELRYTSLLEWSYVVVGFIEKVDIPTYDNEYIGLPKRTYKYAFSKYPNMLTKRTSYYTVLLSAFVLFSVAMVPMLSDNSDAKEITPGISYVYDGGSVKISAGSSSTVSFYIANTDTSSKYVHIMATPGNSDVTVSSIKFGTTGTSWTSLNGNTNVLVTLTLAADGYAHQGDSDLKITIRSTDETYDPTNPDTYEEGSFNVTLNVTSNLTSEKYNKFFGIFPNNFDGVLGNIWVTAVVSFFGLLAFGYVVMFIAVPLCSRIVMKKDDPDRPALKKLLYRLAQFIIWLWVIGQILRIFGSNEELIDLVNKIFYFSYIIVGAFVAWQLYKLIINSVINRIVSRAADYEMDEKRMDFDSFRPLFMYIGEIVLSIVTIMLLMSLLGFDLGAIITSAGLVSLGISMGAQDVLKQFFAGLEILVTRPFKKGDIITVGTDSTIFVVKKVNVMNTFLANWDNTDVNIMPNSTITTSKIRNMTRETLMWKVYLSTEVSYGTDVNLARSLIQEAASQNPHVVSDGSVSRPYTRLDAFGDDNLIIKMGFYVDDYNNQYSVSGQIRQDIIQKFNENGINIDYAQIVVHEAEPELRGNTTAKVIPRSS